MTEEFDSIFKKCRDVKNEIKNKNYRFNISYEDLPDLPETASGELIEFVAENFRFISLTDQRDLLSYILFVFDQNSFDDLIGELANLKGIDIDELLPCC